MGWLLRWLRQCGAINGIQPSMANSSAPNSSAQNEMTTASEAAGQTGTAAPVEARYQLITEVADLQAFLAIARKQGFVAVDTETTSLNAAAADPCRRCHGAGARSCVLCATAPWCGAKSCRFSGQTGLDFDGVQDGTPVKQIPFDDAILLLEMCLRTRLF